MDNNVSLPPLPENTQSLLDEMNSKEPQGASRRIRQINNLFVAIAEGWKNPDTASLIATILKVGDYYIETRGKNTPAIANAIHQTLHGIDDLTHAEDISQIKEFLVKRRDINNADSIDKAHRIAKIGANLFRNIDVIMPFDYSGTVMGILKAIAENGRSIKLIVPESRSIRGGYPILKQALALGHSVQLIVDMAYPSFMDEVQAVIIGSEAIFSSGECWNTVGGYAVATMAAKHQTPFYVATDLIKIDPESFFGVDKEIQQENFRNIYSYIPDDEVNDKLSFIAPKLDKIPAELIKAYITEQGLIPPTCIYIEARKYLENIGVFEFDEKN